MFAAAFSLKRSENLLLIFGIFHPFGIGLLNARLHDVFVDARPLVVS